MTRLAVALLAGLLLVVGTARAEAPGQDRQSPNVVLLMTDDQTVGDMAVMPLTRRLIGGAGVTFTRSYVSYPLCCPSRATYLTGQYTHNHHVRCLYKWCGGGYGSLRTREYLPVWLQRAGYVTAHMGKYLNGYGDKWPAGGPTGLDRVVRADRPQHLPDVGIQDVRERPRARVRQAAGRAGADVPDRRAEPKGRVLHRASCAGA